MSKQVLELQGKDVKIGDVLKSYKVVPSNGWAEIYNNLAHVVRMNNKIWVKCGVSETWWDLGYQYKVEREVAEDWIEVTGDQLQLGDVMLGWYAQSDGRLYDTNDSRRDWTLVNLDKKHPLPYMELRDGGKFQATSDRKYRVMRPNVTKAEFPCAPVEDLGHKQLIQSAEMKMHYRDNGRVHCPNGEPIKMTHLEHTAWSVELRNKKKAAEEKERNRVQVDLEYEPWE